MCRFSFELLKTSLLIKGEQEKLALDKEMESKANSDGVIPIDHFMTESKTLQMYLKEISEWVIDTEASRCLQSSEYIINHRLSVYDQVGSVRSFTYKILRELY